MTVNEYLAGLLDGQKLTKDETDALQSLRKTIEKALRDDLGTTPRIYYGGSYGKKTMIKAAYDLDLVFYYAHDSNTPVKQIRKDVRKCFTDRNWSVTDKDVALRLHPDSRAFHVDVVPGRAQNATYYQATLYRSKSDTTMQTSVKAHIDAVSNRRELVKLMKLWKLKHGVRLKTFILELAVLEGVRNQSTSDLQDQMVAALTWLRDDLVNAKLVDPANSANVVSSELNILQRCAVSQVARNSLIYVRLLDWRRVV